MAGRQLDEQIANLHSYFQNKAEISIQNCAIIEADETTPLQLKDWDFLQIS